MSIIKMNGEEIVTEVIVKEKNVKEKIVKEKIVKEKNAEENNVKENKEVQFKKGTDRKERKEDSPPGNGPCLVVLEMERLEQKEEAQEYLAKSFGFPDYYGRNLDALYDCLGERTGVVRIVLKRKEDISQNINQNINQNSPGSMPAFQMIQLGDKQKPETAREAEIKAEAYAPVGYADKVLQVFYDLERNYPGRFQIEQVR